MTDLTPEEHPHSVGAADIARERERQVRAEGWTPEHDDEHSGGEMVRAAICYAKGFGNAPGMHWPWADEWWKPKDRRSDLVRAGALIAAEIDRLDRAALALPDHAETEDSTDG